MGKQTSNDEHNRSAQADNYYYFISQRMDEDDYWSKICAHIQPMITFNVLMWKFLIHNEQIHESGAKENINNGWKWWRSVGPRGVGLWRQWFLCMQAYKDSTTVPHKEAVHYACRCMQFLGQRLHWWPDRVVVFWFTEESQFSCSLSFM